MCLEVEAFEGCLCDGELYRLPTAMYNLLVRQRLASLL